MAIRYYKEPILESPILLASWPGIGNIGLLAFNTLRELLQAEEMAEIEPWDYFYPNKIAVRKGELVDLSFPDSRFYFKRTGKRDIVFFIGEEQPSEGGTYASGPRAYAMANLVVDVAKKFGCERIYSSGAAVSAIHHTAKPKVWAVPTKRSLIPEIRKYENTVLMSDIEGRGGQGNISGLNGLLLGVAKKRDLEAICVMGEIPVYLQGFPIIYPKASKSVLELIISILDIEVDLKELSKLAERNEQEIEAIYQRLPGEITGQLDKLKYVIPQSPSPENLPITEEDKRKILEEIDTFFQKTDDGNNQ